jgi:hypothetical protein
MHRPILCTLAAALLFWSISAQAQQTDAPAVPSVPVVNRANEVLPSWLRVRGEFRERMEGFTGAGFAENRDDVYWLSRLRLNASIIPTKTLSFTVQVQDARVGDKQIGPAAAPFRAPFDVRAAFADVGDPLNGAVSARVGRQELAFGEQRLVGHANWLNTARTFDAGRVTVRRPAFQVDAFAGSVVRIQEKAFDRSGNGNQFYGAYGVLGNLVPKGSVEPYVFHRSDRHVRTESGALARLRVTTVGARWVGQLPARLDYGIEMAVQTGSVGSDSVAAWAAHWQLRESFGGRLAIRTLAEFNYATGDKSATDGRRATFDQLYPTAHDKYGLADQIGWRNIQHLRAGVELTPFRRVQVTSSYHSWWLAETSDALYSAAGAVFVPAMPGAGGHVGQELDIQAQRPITPQIQLSGGYAYVFPGVFLTNATPGHAYGSPYVMVTYVLLAER